MNSNAQVNAVGSGKAYCNHEDSFWPTVDIEVRCYNEAGVLQDSKFKILIAMPANHLAYAWAERLTSDEEYEPHASFRWSPPGSQALVERLGVGYYRVTWAGVDPYVVEGGVVQVTAQHAGNAQCKVTAHLVAWCSLGPPVTEGPRCSLAARRIGLRSLAC